MKAGERKKPFRFNATRLEPRSEGEDVRNLQTLLATYGYLRDPFVPGVYDAATGKAVGQFQAFYRIQPDEDRVCDEATVRALSRPRCGMPDGFPSGRSPSGRLSPFVAVGSTWPVNNLRFRFLNASQDMPEDRQRDIVRESFTKWAGVCALKFREVGGNEASELSIGFFRRSHGDGSPFDESGGPQGNTLAHAFFPPPNGGGWAGSLHFDDFETWKPEPGGAGTLLSNVALHEIGHLLGLAHSQDEAAIMFAYYGEDRNALRADDIAGIQSLYGTGTTAPIAIALGEKSHGQLDRKDAEARYQLTVQRKLLLRLGGPAGADFDVYVKHGSPPGKEAGTYDVASQGWTSDELVTIDAPKPGTYHILVHSYDGSGTFELEAECA